MIRAATKNDAEALAYLTNLAGEGMPAFMWQSMAEEGELAHDVGLRRVTRDEGDFSYRHAVIYEQNGQAAATMLTYQLDDPYDLSEIDTYPECVKPLVELEALAPGSWYINILATYEKFQKQGIGAKLIKEAENQAKAENIKQLTLIVADENTVAHNFYKKIGFVDREDRSVVLFPGCAHGGKWILMEKEIN